MNFLRLAVSIIYLQATILVLFVILSLCMCNDNTFYLPSAAIQKRQTCLCHSQRRIDMRLHLLPEQQKSSMYRWKTCSTYKKISSNVTGKNCQKIDVPSIRRAFSPKKCVCRAKKDFEREAFLERERYVTFFKSYSHH